MILKKFSLLALALFALASVPRAHAGTEMVEPNYAPAPKYHYAPPPPPPVVYYAPPPIRIAVYPAVVPAYGYCGPRVGFGYQRLYGHRAYCGPRHWR